ncbi:MAG TPA: tetratricopeptide repeat protein [Tenuifilaceae bacterium]|nr:tetratricopeptide repeat protein [Tenuifilaceae bacterium]
MNILKKIIAFFFLLMLGKGYSQNLDSLIRIINSNPQQKELSNIILQLADPPSIGSKQADSLIAIIKNNCNHKSFDHELALIYMYYGKEFLINGKYRQSIDSLQKSLKYFSLIDSSNIAIIYQYLSSSYRNLNVSDSAFLYCNLAKDIYEKNGDIKRLAFTYNTLGGIYFNQGKIEEAINAFSKSLNLKKKTGDSISMANTLNNIAMIYDAQNKNDEALNLYKEALNIYTLKNITRGIEWSCNNIALVYKRMGKYEEALDMFLKSLEIDKKLNNADEQSKTLNNIGLLHLAMNNYSMAISYLEQANKIFNEIHNENGLAATYINLGKSYLKLEQPSKATKFFEKALSTSQKINALEWIRDSYEGLYMTSKLNKDFRNSTNYLEKYKQYDDTLKSLSNLNKIDELRIQFETEKKQRQIDLLEKDQQLNKLELKRQSTYIQLMITLALSVLVILSFTIFYLHKVKKDRLKLRQMNSEIESQNEEITSQRDMLKMANAELIQQKEELQTQTDNIETLNKQITLYNHRLTESLEYASLIQKSIFPQPQLLKKYFNDYFLILKPKDQVSGDLYWMWENENSNEITFAIADCTGHGVAGAFMSILTVNILTNAVGIVGLKEPAEISKFLYKQLLINNTNTFDSNYLLGIDFIIGKYSTNSKVLKFSGSHMNFYHVSNEVTQLIKVERNFNRNSEFIEFTEKSINLKSNDRLYFITDGYYDQINSIKRKKMGRNEFYKILEQAGKLNANQQVPHFEDCFNNWKGEYEQIDDVLVLGLFV